MITFATADQYILAVPTQVERITRISAVIDALQLMAIKAAGTGNMDEYSLDDGQTKIRTKYRDAAQIVKAIEYFQRLEQSMIARLNNNLTGCMVRLVDSKNFIR